MASHGSTAGSIGHGDGDGAFMKAPPSPKTKYFSQVKAGRGGNTGAAQEVYVWNNPAVTLSEEEVRSLAASLINISGTVSSEMAAVHLEHQKKLLDLGMEIFSAWTESVVAGIPMTDGAKPVDVSRILEPVGRGWNVQLDLVNQLCEVNRKALDAILKLPLFRPECGSA